MLEKEETEVEVKNKDTQTITEMFIAQESPSEGQRNTNTPQNRKFSFCKPSASVCLSVSGSVSMYLCIYLCMYLFNLFVFVFVLFSSFRQEEIYKTAWQHSRKKVKYISINTNIKKEIELEVK